MLKIYNAYAINGKIIIADYVTFRYGKLETHSNGYGYVKSEKRTVLNVNYEMKKLDEYNEYLEKRRGSECFIEDFTIFNPANYEMLENEYKYIKRTEEAFEKAGLNEEGILLFTKSISINYRNNDLIRRIHGKYPKNGIYLIMPNASFTMTAGSYSKEYKEQYEVLQSQNLGKRLSLTKMDRII